MCYKIILIFFLSSFISYVHGRVNHVSILGHHIHEHIIRPPREGASLFDSWNVDTKYFEQKLDNFNKSNVARWKQRYYVSDDHYLPGGPIFVMIGGESEIDISRMTEGPWYSNAQKHHALMFHLEHRFYGDSRPTLDTSVENLRYLSSMQALADLDAFVHGMKKEYNIPEAKVIVFGGSYPGNLAVWYRELYPDSTVGAVASSATVLAKENYMEYMETVGEAIKSISLDCYNDIEEAIKAIQALIDAREYGRLNMLFKICEPNMLDYSNPKQVTSFYTNLIYPWASATLYNKLGNASALAIYCKTMTTRRLFDNSLIRYATWYQLHVKTCVFYDDKAIEDIYKLEDWDEELVESGTRQWVWQKCTEFAHFGTTDSEKHPFGQTIDIKYLENHFCEATFGISSMAIARGVAKTNKRYRGKSPKVTNVFFLNGSLDPWYRLGIFDSNITSTYRLIEGTSHCYDMNDDNADDSPSLIQARLDVADTISLWLGKQKTNLIENTTSDYSAVQNPGIDWIDDTTTPQFSSILEVTTDSVDVSDITTGESTYLPIEWMLNNKTNEHKSADQNRILVTKNSAFSHKISKPSIIMLVSYIFWK